MKTVLQRVSQASVTVDHAVIGEIRQGILILVGFQKGDTLDKLPYHVKKIRELRIFPAPDNIGKMNHSVTDIQGGLLVVSQFTLAADCQKGTRPSFDQALPPKDAEALYHAFIAALKTGSTLRVETGQFGAMMDVSLLNDGPVTLILEN